MKSRKIFKDYFHHQAIYQSCKRSVLATRAYALILIRETLNFWQVVLRIAPLKIGPGIEDVFSQIFPCGGNCLTLDLLTSI